VYLDQESPVEVALGRKIGLLEELKIFKDREIVENRNCASIKSADILLGSIGS
jgi:hypothetical protein